MLASISTATVMGVDGTPVDVEVHVSTGLPSFTVVGLPDVTVREARDRVRAALLSVKKVLPQQRVTVNLAPTGVRKIGSGLDLAMAVGIMAASEQLPGLDAEGLRQIAFVGELGLDGTVRPVTGMVPIVDAIDAADIVVPAAAAHEARLVARGRVRPVRHLLEVIEALTDGTWPSPPDPDPPPPPPPPPDLADVRGQPVGRQALEIAAAGGHHILMLGPPGAGKTMLASRLAGILPPLEPREAVEVTRIHSAAGLSIPVGDLVRTPPFRAPHHSATRVSLIGGGTAIMRPGEISAAHRGVLFLDEIAEFPPSVLDQLRQPLEDGVVRVSRARASVTFPARFLLVAAANPCPCGGGDRPGHCTCTESSRARYRRRISGPILDRFDLRITIGRPDPGALMAAEAGESSAAVAKRVAEARARAAHRGVSHNARLSRDQLERFAPLRPEASALLTRHLEVGGLTARGVDRIRRVALTIADLAGDDGPLTIDHVAHAAMLRADLRTGVAA